MNQTISRLRAAHDVGEGWTVDDAAELYEIARWGKGYFSIGENGQVRIHPTKDASRSINLKQLVDDLQLRGIGLPTLIRFRDILQHRLKEIHDAFQTAIAQHEYSGRYVCVYPIKVNQQCQVVEEVLGFGRPYRFGLEAGSKPELLTVVALADNDTPIICNGFKDAEFIEMVMLAQKIGRTIIPVGIGGIKAGGLAPFAERFREEGFAAIAFDYRNFGGSGGQPREVLSVPRQRADYSTVIGWEVPSTTT